MLQAPVEDCVTFLVSLENAALKLEAVWMLLGKSDLSLGKSE